MLRSRALAAVVIGLNAAVPAWPQTSEQLYYYLPWPGAHRDQYRVIGQCPNPAPGFVYIQPTDGRSPMCAQTKDLQPAAPPPAPGAPGSTAWFMGRWSFSYIGATVDRIRGDWLIRHEETGARGGYLQLNANRSYVWDQGQPSLAGNVIRGRWRPATPQEMRGYEGDGLVLQQGERGWDWLVVRYFGASGRSQNWIEILDNGTRNLERLGRR